MDKAKEPEKRVFIALALPDELKAAIASAGAILASSNKSVKPIPSCNVHITLKFLGGTAVKRLPKIFAAVNKAACETDCFSLQIRESIEAFPSAENPKVLYFPVNDGRVEIIELFAKIEKYLKDIGFEKEKRKYVPHVTVARVRDKTDLSKDLEEVRLSAEVESVCSCTKAIVFESILKPSGAEYRVLHEAVFK